VTDTIALLPARVDLKLYRGDDFGPQEFIWEQPAGSPVDITGYEIAAQIREDPDSDEVLAVFTCTITNPAAGKWTLELDGAITADLPRSAYWDMQLTSGGVTRTFASGRITTARDVTRPA
jgi:hypothetical protein